ncbi:MAG: 6-phosphofructokinase [Planctomycetaceae bacterium]|nr:6-phosphofructokinase [Planctomycetaceae bacterium]
MSQSHGISKVAMLFSGGPAPAANAVISTCAISCINNGVDVVGIKYGYSNLINFSPDRPLQEGKDYISLSEVMLRRTRSKQGILIGTARANPGKHVNSPEDLKDPEKIAPLKKVYEGLCSIGVDALVSIGGDDTLKTANKFKLFQESLPAGSKRIPVVHVPKTIDNDYMGIDFTFGYFTAVETLGTEIRNLHADAEAGRSYFIVESMGRSAGWLAYGAAISGEASMVLSVEDITDQYLAPESTAERKVMDIDKVVGKIVRMMRYRQEKQGKEYGVVVLAEGLAEYLSDEVLQDVPRDDHGHISVAHVDLGKMFAKRVSKEYERQTGSKRKVTGLQLGYESRCARPQAFDVMLGSQLGVGAYRALCEEKLNGVMVSVSGQLDLHYVPFEKLVDPATLVTVVRFISKGSDFHKLARFLETSIND